MNAFEFIPLLANLPEGPVKWEWPTALETILYLGGIVFFLLLNAFFVASEFAIVKVRPSQIETVVKENPVRAARAQRVVDHLDGYLSANQFGITIASLFLGFLGEPFVTKLVGPLLAMTGMPDNAIKWVAYVFAIGSFTFLHVVFGELVPKSI